MAEQGILDTVKYYSSGIKRRLMIYGSLCAIGGLTGGPHDLAVAAGACAVIESGIWLTRYGIDKGWLPDEIEVDRKTYKEMKEFALSHGYEPAIKKQ